MFDSVITLIGISVVPIVLVIADYLRHRRKQKRNRPVTMYSPRVGKEK